MCLKSRCRLFGRKEIHVRHYTCSEKREAESEGLEQRRRERRAEQRNPKRKSCAYTCARQPTHSDESHDSKS